MPCFAILQQSCIWLVAFKECGVVMPSCTLASLNLQQQVVLGYFYTFSASLRLFLVTSNFPASSMLIWNPYTVNLTVWRDDDYWRHIYDKKKNPEHVRCAVTALSASLLLVFSMLDGDLRIRPVISCSLHYAGKVYISCHLAVLSCNSGRRSPYFHDSNHGSSNYFPCFAR